MKKLFLLLFCAMASACAGTPTPRVVTYVPQGTLLFSAASVEGDGKFSLFTMNADGANRQPLPAPPGESLGAKWSPDGKSIALSAQENDVAQIFVMSADGKNRRQLTKVKNAINVDWSPDGKQIAFASNDYGQYDIYTINADGTGLRKITQDAGDHLQPAWSPEGGKIAYVAAISASAEFSQTFQLFVTDLTGKAEQVTREAGVDYQYPAWSHDGKKLAFAADPTGAYEIYLMDFAARDAKPLTQSGDPATQPRFSPDDKFIVYTVFTAEGWRLHLMTAEGKAQTPIDNKNASEFFGDWKK